MAPADDGRLWERVQAGDASAFGALFDRHANAVHSYCFRRTADWALAEDSTSLVFFEAWRGRARLRPSAGALPLLLGIATNVLRNQRRARRRHRAFLERLPALQPERDFAEDLPARLDAEADTRRLLAEVARLPRREQDVVALCSWSGLTPAEAAGALGLPQATVRTRLHRARRRLRDAVEPLETRSEEALP